MLDEEDEVIRRPIVTTTDYKDVAHAKNIVEEPCSICHQRTYRTGDVLKGMANLDGDRFLAPDRNLEDGLVVVPVCVDCGLQIWASINFQKGDANVLNINNHK